MSSDNSDGIQVENIIKPLYMYHKLVLFIFLYTLFEKAFNGNEKNEYYSDNAL